MRTTGKFSWGILLGKFNDQPQEPFPRQYFSDLISGRAMGSLGDYWSDMSYGALDLSDAVVYGWLTMPVAADAGFFALSRWDKTQKCYDTVFASLETLDDIGRFLAHDGLIVVVNAGASDSGRVGNRVLLDSSNWRHTYIAHETGHVLGLDHSFDTNSAAWDALDDGRPGAYGDSRDIMSAETFAGLPTTFTGRFGTTGPGLCARSRANFGWLSDARVTRLTNNPGDDWGTQLDLAALDDPSEQGNLMLEVSAAGAFGGAPLEPMVYTAEFRPQSGWDAGLPADAVVIHMTRGADVPRIAWSSANSQGWHAADRFVDVARRTSIEVAWIGADKSQASLFVAAGAKAALPVVSVRKSLARKFDLTRGLRAITPRAPFAADSLRARLLDNPPQFGP